jgi:hypothetical protein
MKALRESRGIALICFFYTTALDGDEGQRHAPAAIPPGKTRYPLYRRLGGPQGRSGQVRKISHPPGFDLRTVQHVACRYTDWATGPTLDIYKQLNINQRPQRIKCECPWAEMSGLVRKITFLQDLRFCGMINIVRGGERTVTNDARRRDVINVFIFVQKRLAADQTRPTDTLALALTHFRPRPLQQRPTEPSD